MISQVELLDAINELLIERFPTFPVYRDEIPEKFERPCFFLMSGKRRTNAINYCTVQVEQQITIRCIDEIDEHYEAVTDRLSAIADKVEGIFYAGYIRVSDRALTIGEFQTLRDPVMSDISDTTVLFTWFDDRPTIEEELPTVKTVETNIKEG